MSNKYGQRRAEEGLEEGRIEVNNGENPVEGVYDVSNDFKGSVQLLSVPADYYYTVLCQDVM